MRITLCAAICATAFSCAESPADGTPFDVTVTPDVTQAADVPPAPADVAAGVDTPAPEDVPVPDELPPPADVPPADAGQPDTPDPPPETCDVADPLKPFGVLITPETAASGVGVVTDIGPYCCDADWDFQLAIDLSDGTTLTAVGKLPGAPIPPLALGETVTVHHQVDMPWWVEHNLVILGPAGELRFWYHSGTENLGPPDGCPECPALSLAQTTCEPVEVDCGTRLHPPVDVTLGAATASLRQGQQGPLGDDVALGIARAHHWVDIQCTDIPSKWIDAWAVSTLPIHEPECDTDKIALTQANPQKYELYELCLPKDADPAAVKAIDEKLACGVAGVFAKCDSDTQMGCNTALKYEPGTKTLSAEMWAQLCALSLLSDVSNIAGGHYL